MLENLRSQDQSTVTREGIEHEEIIRMICVMGAFYSILSAMGIRQYRPIAVVVESMKQVEQFANSVMLFRDNRLVSLNTSKRQMKGHFQVTHDDVIVVCYSKNPKTQESMEGLCELVRYGYIEDEKIECLVLVIFEQLIPEAASGYFDIIISLPSQAFMEQGPEKDIKLKIFSEALSKLDVFMFGVKLLLKEEWVKEKTENIPDAVLLYAAAKIVNILYEEVDSGNIAQGRYDVVDSIINRSVERWEVPELSELFVDELHRMANGMEPMVDREFIEKMCLDSVKARVLYDSDFYYLTEKIFCDVCDPLLNFATITEVKESLVKKGILYTNDGVRRYYSVKVTICRTEQGYFRQRYYKLNRNLVDQVGVVDLVTAAKIKGEGKADVEDWKNRWPSIVRKDC